MRIKKNSILQKTWLYIFLGYFFILIVIFVLAYAGTLPVNISFIPFYDTLGHFILLGLTAYLLHRALGRKTVEIFNIHISIGILVVILFVIIEENLQRLSPNRTFDLMDLVANLSGILFVYWLDTKLLTTKPSPKS